MARGGFDPKLYSEWEQKSFDGKEYFTLGETGFKIPTWAGVELKGNFLVSGGDFLNPENTLPTAGQAVAGVKVSLLQGMFIDERRAMLRQEELFEKYKKAEIINAGMIPKLDNGFRARKNGVKEVLITNASSLASGIGTRLF
jgi:hypothetical protein